MRNALRRWFRRAEPRWEYHSPAGILSAPAWVPEDRWLEMLRRWRELND